MSNITTLQKLWLNNRGGRTVNDVIEINGVLFIAMASKRQWKAVEVPDDTYINNNFRLAKQASTNEYTRLVARYYQKSPH